MKKSVDNEFEDFYTVIRQKDLDELLEKTEELSNVYSQKILNEIKFVADLKKVEDRIQTLTDIFLLTRKALKISLFFNFAQFVVMLYLIAVIIF